MTHSQKLEAAELKLAEAKKEISEVRAAMKAEKACKIKKGTWCLCWNKEFLRKKGPSIRKFDRLEDGKFYMIGDGGSKTFGWDFAIPLSTTRASNELNALLSSKGESNLF